MAGPKNETTTAAITNNGGGQADVAGARPGPQASGDQGPPEAAIPHRDFRRRGLRLLEETEQEGEDRRRAAGEDTRLHGADAGQDGAGAGEEGRRADPEADRAQAGGRGGVVRVRVSGVEDTAHCGGPDEGRRRGKRQHPPGGRPDGQAASGSRRGGQAPNADRRAGEVVLQDLQSLPFSPQHSNLCGIARHFGIAVSQRPRVTGYPGSQDPRKS